MLSLTKEDKLFDTSNLCKYKVTTVKVGRDYILQNRRSFNKPTDKEELKLVNKTDT